MPLNSPQIIAHGSAPVESWYRTNLTRGINPARWAEYSVGASLMIVLIAILPSITDIYALIGPFAVHAATMLFGCLIKQTI